MNVDFNLEEMKLIKELAEWDLEQQNLIHEWPSSEGDNDPIVQQRKALVLQLEQMLKKLEDI